MVQREALELRRRLDQAEAERLDSGGQVKRLLLRSILEQDKSKTLMHIS